MWSPSALLSRLPCPSWATQTHCMSSALRGSWDASRAGSLGDLVTKASEPEGAGSAAFCSGWAAPGPPPSSWAAACGLLQGGGFPKGTDPPEARSRLGSEVCPHPAPSLGVRRGWRSPPSPQQRLELSCGAHQEGGDSPAAGPFRASPGTPEPSGGVLCCVCSRRCRGFVSSFLWDFPLSLGPE